MLESLEAARLMQSHISMHKQEEARSSSGA